MHASAVHSLVVAIAVVTTSCSYPDATFVEGPSDAAVEEVEATGGFDVDPIDAIDTDARDANAIDGRDDTPLDAGTDADVVADSDACVTRNDCGGCTMLSATLGGTCGSCSDGIWKCKGTEELVCTGAVINACGGCKALKGTPGAACGICGGGVWVCLGKESVFCSGPAPINECGGCAVLPASLDGCCGAEACFKCSGTDSLTCTYCPGSGC